MRILIYVYVYGKWQNICVQFDRSEYTVNAAHLLCGLFVFGPHPPRPRRLASSMSRVAQTHPQTTHSFPLLTSELITRVESTRESMCLHTNHKHTHIAIHTCSLSHTSYNHIINIIVRNLGWNMPIRIFRVLSRFRNTELRFC